MDIKTFFEQYGCFQFHQQRYKNISTEKEMMQNMFFYSYNVSKKMQKPEMLNDVKNIFETLKTTVGVDYKMKEDDIMLHIKVSKIDNMKKLIKYLEDNLIKPKSKGYERVKAYVLSKGATA